MVDLIVINVSLMLHDLISYFLLDYEFLLKKIRNVKLVNKVMEVRVCVYKGCEYVMVFTFCGLSVFVVFFCVCTRKGCFSGNSLSLAFSFIFLFFKHYLSKLLKSNQE